ncbi:MAG: histidine phosphatase family protein [Brachymonas sp.]|nr:histidine phosphatase family protein [Brachymonas sp.]
MDLIVWRHAEADGQHSNSPDDVLRSLTPHGHHQAERMAAWLEPRLPSGTRILVSPALRCEGTVAYLGRKYKLCDELLPSRAMPDLLQLISWPDRQTPTLLVGHQPALGELIAQLTGMPPNEVSLRKGGLWWLRGRQREGRFQTVTHCVIGPDLI